MPNPTRGLKKKDKLSTRQKGIVSKLRKRKLPVRVYKRGRGLSVHNPFLDVQRRAKKGSVKATKRTPQARDTELQRRLRHRKAPKGARKVRKTTAKKFLLP